MKTKINTKPLDQLLKKSRQVVHDYIKELDDEFQAVISDTYAFADIGLTNQDIIWSGALKASQDMNINDSKNITATWIWDPVDPESGYHYANDVFVGFNAWGDGRFIPGRNWPGKALDRLDPIIYLRKKLKQ